MFKEKTNICGLNFLVFLSIEQSTCFGFKRSSQYLQKGAEVLCSELLEKALENSSDTTSHPKMISAADSKHDTSLYKWDCVNLQKYPWSLKTFL